MQPTPSATQPADAFQKCRGYTRLMQHRERGIYGYYLPLEGSDGPRVQYKGRELVMVGSNNYLGLTHDARVIEAGIDALRRYGTGCTGSRFLNGTYELHCAFERKLADYFQRESALVFATGMQANLGAISALGIQPKELIFSDRENHASIFDACRLAFARTVKYRHSDVEHLNEMLANSDPGVAKMIITDGVFSMSGEIANLPEIAKLAKRYGARLITDEAHSLGVLGDNGRGAPEHFGIETEVDLIIGTFSKSLASIGGYVVGEAEVIDFIKHTGRSIIFSAALSPAMTATASKALDIMIAEPERRTQLWQTADRMRTEFNRLGFNTLNSETPIIPIVIGEEFKTMEVFHDLIEHGVFTNPVIQPAVPDGYDLLRTSYMATHTDDDLDKVLEAFTTVGRKHGII